ncbi:MAG: MFS transporter [Candidatus Hodarchaeales archaeon]|jgi:GPH family glycoside/pentoside/hexuronide:cation symporter
MTEISQRKVILYASGSFGSFLLYFMFTTYILYYYVDILFLDIILYNIGFIIFGIVNAINDPIFGYISDRTKTKHGRRRPYILYMMVPAFIAWILIWFPLFTDPVLYDGLVFFLYFTVIVCVWDSLYTLVDINQQALFPEMFSPEERAGVNSWRFVFAGMGLLTGVALPPIIAESFGTVQQPNYAVAGLVFGALGLLTYAFTFVGSKERPEFQEEPLDFKSGIKRLLNRPFATFVGYNLALNYIAALGPGIIPFFIEYVITDYNLPLMGTITPSIATTLILGVMFIIGIISIPFWGILINKMGSRKATMIISIVYASGYLPWLFVNTIIESIIFAVFLGFGVGGVLIVPDMLISQVIDEDEVLTGKRREGMHYGFNNLVIRTSFVFYSITTTIVFLLTGYEAELAVQPATAVFGLRLLESVFPILAVVFALFCIVLYPLDGDRWKNIKQKRIQLHQEKKVRLEKS